jgi:hypothetical protein
MVKKIICKFNHRRVYDVRNLCENKAKLSDNKLFINSLVAY